jgi:hypothetical protein
MRTMEAAVLFCISVARARVRPTDPAIAMQVFPRARLEPIFEMTIKTSWASSTVRKTFAICAKKHSTDARFRQPVMALAWPGNCVSSLQKNSVLVETRCLVGRIVNLRERTCHEPVAPLYGKESVRQLNKRNRKSLQKL